MRASSRLSAVGVAPLLAALVLGACGGGNSADAPTHSAPGEPGHVARRQAPPRPTDAEAAWSEAKVVRRLAGRVVTINGRQVRIDRATVTCGGDGRGTRRGHTLVWRRFVCTQPTFPGTAVAGPDAVFRVEPAGVRSFRITEARFTRY
jgi:hypothetical protein